MSRERSSTSRSLNSLKSMTSSIPSSKVPRDPDIYQKHKGPGAREGEERQIDQPTSESRPSNYTVDPAELERFLARLLLQIFLSEKEE